MAKALIVFASRKGETGKIADLIAEGLRFSAVDVTLADAKDIQNENKLVGYDAYIFGSPTYHGDMLPNMKAFLFVAEKADLAGRAGGAFGAFGWSGEATDRIYDTMANIFRMDMAREPLRLKSSILEGAIKMAQDYGREVAAKIT